jgi:hypothetical protein
MSWIAKPECSRSFTWGVSLETVKQATSSPKSDVVPLVTAIFEIRSRVLTIAEVGMQLDAGAVARILAAVGEKYVPPDLDKHALVMGLASCLATYSAAVERRSDKPTKDRIRRLKDIQSAAKRLERQLVPDDVWDWSEAYWECEYLHPEVGYLIQRLGREIKDLGFKLKWGLDCP